MADPVQLVWNNRSLFEAVRLHNLAVIIRRTKGGDWDAPENQYRNFFAEVSRTGEA
jgi:hypothetical protein